jgi:Domain of unknown function (DUF4258)
VRIKISDHAREAIGRRGLVEDEVFEVASRPEQVIPIRPGRVLAQSIRRFGDDEKIYLLRVVIDLWPDGAEVVTAYRTSRIARYWKGVQ